MDADAERRRGVQPHRSPRKRPGFDAGACSDAKPLVLVEGNGGREPRHVSDGTRRVTLAGQVFSQHDVAGTKPVDRAIPQAYLNLTR